jgi:CheY-like chemotaxis protein
MKTIAREPAEILVIDRDPVAVESVQSTLMDAGHVVHQAENRETALRIARSQALDLVICDVHLGSDSGLDLWRELRSLPGMQDLPVMFVSSTQLPDIVRRSHHAGGAYYLRKPLDGEVLIDLVSKALWLPHLVRTRVSLHGPATQPANLPHRRQNSKYAAIQGIRLPQA